MQKQMFDDKRDLTNMVITREKEMTRRIEKFCKSIPDAVKCGFTRFEILPNRIVRLWNDNRNTFIEYKTRFEIGEIVAVVQSYKDMYTPPLIDGNGNHFIIGNATAGWNNKMFVKSCNCIHQIKITDIKIECLQDISNKDCVKEGIFKHISHARLYWTFYGIGNYFFDTPKEAYSCMIDLISGKGTWNENPYVVAYSFELIK